jgi:hypothetical protein
MIIYIYIYIYIYTHTYTFIVRENKIVLVSVSEAVMGGGKRKMLENDKY